MRQFEMNGHYPSAGGLDHMSMLVGEVRQGHVELRNGQAMILDKVEKIETRLEQGTAVHHAHDKRLTTLETKPPPPWWQGLPWTELKWLAGLALAGLLGIVSPAEIKQQVRGHVLQSAPSVSGGAP